MCIWKHIHLWQGWSGQPGRQGAGDRGRAGGVLHLHVLGPGLRHRGEGAVQLRPVHPRGL